jgi:class 3 adenylate cyclase
LAEQVGIIVGQPGEQHHSAPPFFAPALGFGAGRFGAQLVGLLTGAGPKLDGVYALGSCPRGGTPGSGDHAGTAPAPRFARARLTVVRDAEVRFAIHDGKWLAYEVFGSGPSDLLVWQSVCPIDVLWELPQLASFMETLGGFARVIVFDPLGQGASDPVEWNAANLERLSDSILAVLDAVHADRVTFFDMAFGVNAVPFAATYPERVRSVILTNLQPSFPAVRATSSAERQEIARSRYTIESLETDNPRVSHDPVLRQWWLRARRLLVNHETMLAQIDFAANIDVESVLPALRAPALVLHRRDVNHEYWDIETGRVAAAKIPTARFVELPGSESDIFLGDTGPVLAEIQQFLREPESIPTQDRALATVLFTDIVASTEQLAAGGDEAWRRTMDDHDRTMESLVAAYRGRIVKPTGDGILATFDGPARAVRCAAELLDAAAAQGITLRAGLHTGEIEIRPIDVTGIAVHIANRISDLAEPSEILVSRTVVDLTAGSGLQFEGRGEHQLKGVPGSWPTFAAVPNN